MTIGTAIFLSTLLIFIAAMYYLTRDKVKWKKVILVLASVAGLLAAGVAGYTYYKNIPKKINSLDGIALGQTSNQVTLLKGEPNSVKDSGDGKRTYVYSFDDSAVTPAYRVRFNSLGNVDLIAAFYNNPANWLEVNGIWIGMNYENVLKRLGEADEIEKEGEITTCDYFSLNMSVWVKDAKVFGFVVTELKKK